MVMKRSVMGEVGRKGASVAEVMESGMGEQQQEGLDET